jgi:hypothetical protein
MDEDYKTNGAHAVGQVIQNADFIERKQLKASSCGFSMQENRRRLAKASGSPSLYVLNNCKI